MNPKIHRVRVTLEAKPELLWDLLASFKKNPPMIAGPWVPECSNVRFSIIRKNTKGYAMIEITRDLPDTGLWEIKTTFIVSDTCKSDLTKLMEEGPFELAELRERTDEILVNHGWALMHTKFPDTRFEPWQLNNDNYWFRPVQTTGAPEPTKSPLAIHRTPDNDNDNDKARWSILLTNDTVWNGTAWNIGMARRHADDTLITLGFDLAQIGAHDLTQMRRDYEAKHKKRISDRSGKKPQR